VGVLRRYDRHFSGEAYVDLEEEMIAAMKRD
jgi:hypothetical protein